MVGMAYNVLKSPKELKPHNLNVEIYGDESVDMDLVESIQKKGILEPLVIRDDDIILSGHRRWLAAKYLKLDKVPCRTITFDNDLDEKEALIEFNRQRKKTNRQAWKETELLKDIVVERAKLRQESTQLNGRTEDNKPIINNSVSLTSDEPNNKEVKEPSTPTESRADSELAASAGITRDRYVKINKVYSEEKKGNEVAKVVAKQLDDEKITPNAAYETMQIADKAKEGNEKAEKVLKSVIRGDTTPRKALTEIKRAEEKEALPKVETPPLPANKFDVIYVDPPWKYDFAETNNREIENHYQTMEMEDMKKLLIPASSESVILMWATMPKLIEALDLMTAWDFKYLTGAAWDKEKIGMGYWFRGQHELLLVGKRGNYSPPIPENRFSSVIRDVRTKHSKKPDCVYDMIEKMFPDGKYLEMFARDKHNNKWEAWGNEIK